MPYVEGELLMEAKGCHWCGCIVAGSCYALICEECNEAERIAAEEEIVDPIWGMDLND